MVHVVEAPAASVLVPHDTAPVGDVAAKFVIGAPPVFDTVTLIETALPVGTDGPGAAPAGKPLAVGVPTEMTPARTSADPVKYTDDEPDKLNALLVPVTVTDSVFWPWAAVAVMVHVVDAPAANVADPQVNVPDGDVAARFVIAASPVFVTGTTIETVLAVTTDGPGAAPAGWPFTVGAPMLIAPAPPPALPVKNTVEEPDRVSPLLVPVIVIANVFWPCTAVAVMVHVVDAPAASVVAAHVRLPAGVLPPSPVIGEPPVFDTGTTIETVLPVTTDGPGAVPAG